MAFNKFSSEDIVLSSEAVSVPIWTGNKTTITQSELTTSSNQISGLSGDFYVDVYNVTGSGISGSEVQFAVAYASKYGSGSRNYNDAVDGYSPSRTNYGQYRSLILGDEESDFSFNSGSVNNNFWVISIDRARYKESLIPGSFELTLSGSTFIDSGNYSGSIRYIDSGRVYNIYKKDGSSVDTGSSHGYFLPDIGVILLECSSDTVSPDDFSPSTSGKISSYNANLFRTKIDSFTVRSSETISSNYIFVRAKNSEFNYSMNPSNITGNGELRDSIMINQPETYITTVGLYNDNQDLLAVAKLSRPLAKNFNKEALIRIKLDY